MIEINNLTAEVIDEKFLEKVAKIVLKGERKMKADLSIALVSPVRMRELNKEYRKKDRATDVLSFSGLKEKLKNFKVARAQKSQSLGEIIICPSEVKKNAKKYGFTFKKEIARVLIHGILHLFGYDHGKRQAEAEKMQAKEAKYLMQIGTGF